MDYRYCSRPGSRGEALGAAVDLGQQLALTQPWWMWSAKPIRSALVGAHLRHWLPIVRNELERNKQNDRVPSSWGQLAQLLDRDGRNVSRWTSGAAAVTIQGLLGMSSVLDVPIGSLFPETREWVERIVSTLCGNSELPVEVRAYVG